MSFTANANEACVLYANARKKFILVHVCSNIKLDLCEQSIPKVNDLTKNYMQPPIYQCVHVRIVVRH